MKHLPALPIKSLKIFLSTLIAIFILTSLHLIGIKAPQLIVPLPTEPDVFFDTIVPKLQEKGSTYRLYKKQEFIPKAHATGEYEEASAYVVVSFDSGDIIASKNLSKALPIASLTKIMTSIVALDLADPSERFAMTKSAAAAVPTKLVAPIGEEFTVDELLHATLMTSANDAAGALKDGIDAKYGKKVFIRAMNEKAQSLGLQHTSFANPQGFDDPNNYSSVEDLAILTHYAIANYPLLAEIAKKDYLRLQPDSFHGMYHLPNWNGLIGVYPATTGVKIGNTGDAGKTTVVVSEREGKKVMAIVLGAPGIIQRDLWAAQLLDLAYEETMKLDPVAITEEQLREKYISWQRLFE